MIKYVEKNGDNTHSVGYTYDDINNLTALVETIGNVERKTSYTYDEDNRPTSVTADGSSRRTGDGSPSLSQKTLLRPLSCCSSPVLLLFGTVALASNEGHIPEISYAGTDVAYGPPSPNNDDDDDYYDNDNNFGGRQKVGKPKGKTPGNNKAQNKQFNDATKGLPKDAQTKLHQEFSGQGEGYHEILEAAKNYFPLGFGLFELLWMEEWEERLGL